MCLQTSQRVPLQHGFAGVTEASAKAAIRAGFAAPPPPEQNGVRYVGDGKSFWRPLVAAAMGGAVGGCTAAEPIQLPNL
jgi:hypothetical protein